MNITPRVAGGAYVPAMTFDEIGRRLGISKKHAYHIYLNALRKLRNRPHTIACIRDLVNERRRMLERDPEAVR